MKSYKEIYNFICEHTKPEWLIDSNLKYEELNFIERRIDSYITILNQFGFAIINEYESITDQNIKFDGDLNILETDFKKVKQKTMADLLAIKEIIIKLDEPHRIARYIKLAEDIVTRIDSTISLDQSLNYSQKENLIDNTYYHDDTLFTDEYWNLRINPHYDNDIGKMYKLLSTIYSYAARSSGELEIIRSK